MMGKQGVAPTTGPNSAIIGTFDKNPAQHESGEVLLEQQRRESKENLVADVTWRLDTDDNRYERCLSLSEMSSVMAVINWERKPGQVWITWSNSTCKILFTKFKFMLSDVWDDGVHVFS